MNVLRTAEHLAYTIRRNYLIMIIVNNNGQLWLIRVQYKGEQKYISFYCCFDCSFHVIDVFSASLPLRTFPLCVSCSPCMTHVRTPSVCQRDTFFSIKFDRVHLGVPNRKRVVEIHHYQSHKWVVGVPNLCTVRVTWRVCSTSETALLLTLWSLPSFITSPLY